MAACVRSFIESIVIPLLFEPPDGPVHLSILNRLHAQRSCLAVLRHEYEHQSLSYTDSYFWPSLYACPDRSFDNPSSLKRRFESTPIRHATHAIDRFRPVRQICEMRDIADICKSQ